MGAYVIRSAMENIVSRNVTIGFWIHNELNSIEISRICFNVNFNIVIKHLLRASVGK